LLHKRISAAHAVDFCDKHKVSLDWLLCGDLKGLQRMTKEAKAATAHAPQIREAQWREFRRLFDQLRPDWQATAVAYVRQLAGGGGAA
jgi:hypothetical protein